MKYKGLLQVSAAVASAEAAGSVQGAGCCEGSARKAVTAARKLLELSAADGFADEVIVQEEGADGGVVEEKDVPVRSRTLLSAARSRCPCMPLRCRRGLSALWSGRPPAGCRAPAFTHPDGCGLAPPSPLTHLPAPLGAGAAH